jgi:two-component system CheB/CheR fusion protein
MDVRMTESGAVRDRAPAGSPQTRLSRVADACALLTAAIGLLVTAGWMLDIEPLKRVLPGLVAMKFNTAIGFVLAGTGLWCRNRPPLRLALGALVALLGALSLGEYLVGVDLEIDQLFVRDVVGPSEAAFPPGRMAPSTALCFLLIGGALLESGRGLRRPGLRSTSFAGRSIGYTAEVLALAATVIGGFSLIAYPTGAVYLRQLPGSISMALHTAAAFTILGVGILCAAEGIVAQSLSLRGTGRVVWISFGVLTCLLATVGIVFAINVQTLGQDMNAQADVARPRREATLELENRVLGYGLAVREAIAGDTPARHAASEDVIGIERHLAEYRALATTDHQRELAARFAAQWQDVHAQGAALLKAGGPPSPEDLERFAALRLGLEDLLRKEMRTEAVDAFEARKAVTISDLPVSGDLPLLLLLVVSVLLALVTSGVVARAVSRQEQTVREQREWLRVTLSSIGDGVIVCDTGRRVTFLNPVAAALSGWKPEEALGQPIATVFRLINEETHEQAADIAEQVLREGRVLALANHTALVTRDGREVPIEDSAAPITDHRGEVAGAVLVFHDVTQRRRASDVLKESEARLSHAQEMAHLGSWELDLSSNRLTWSDEVYRIFGLEPQQFGATYEAFLDAVHPDDRAAVDAAYSGSVREGRDSYEIEHRVVRKPSGEVRIVHEKCMHSRDAGGQIVRSAGMVHDITERKRAEEALRQNREWLRVTLTSIGDAVIACDTAGRVNFVNPVAAALTGWSVEEALNQSVARVFQIVDEQTRAPAEDIVARVLREGRVVALSNHTALVARDGRAIPIADSAAPIVDEQGAVSGVVLVFHDVTGATHARQEREATIEFLRLVNQSTGTSHLVKVATEFFRSRSGCEAVGIRLREGDDYPYYEASGFPADFVRLENQLCARDHAGNVRRDATGNPVLECMCGNVICGRVDPKKPFFSEEGSFWANDTTRLLATTSDANRQTRTLNRCNGEGYESVALVPLRAGPERFGLLQLNDRRKGMFTPETIALFERLAGYLAVAVAKSRAEEALRESEQCLREIDQRKNEFMAMLSHELRNPLAPIRNSLYILERAAPGGDQAKRAQAVIDRQIGQLARLVDDLLDVTRITRNKIELQRKRLEFNELVQRSVEDQRSVFEKSGVHIDMELAPVSAFVAADCERLSQVVGNLLQNAAKFTPRGGSVRISVTTDPASRRAILRVADTGVGMQPETVSRLFQPFMQADQTLDRSKGGLGLGLALVKGLVELHGGEVCAHSEGLGKGAVFTIGLPLEEAASVEAVATPAVVHRGGRRVLIIEDNVDAADSLREALTFGNHEVVVAYNGPEGIAKARALRPEVVLCDIGLPGVDGYEVARAFRADESLKGTFLVALSGYALREDLQRARDAGFDHHMAKPPSLRALEELLVAPAPGDACGRHAPS